MRSRPPLGEIARRMLFRSIFLFFVFFMLVPVLAAIAEAVYRFRQRLQLTVETRRTSTNTNMRRILNITAAHAVVYAARE